MTESDVQKVLYDRFCSKKNHPMVVPNCKALYPRGESDLISVTQAGLVHEFEIKRSKSDYLREFDSKSRKHEVLKERVSRDGKCTPNYFWFAMDRCLCDKIEVPEYAGLICVGTSGIEVRKKAPRRHSDHITERAEDYLKRGLTVRYWNP